MSDFGFDAHELDDLDAGGAPHPLEIARDLIAMGKPRSALEVLSLHHDQLIGDSEYLLLCSEAWHATGDLLRAQQALLGAVRLAPQDPRPLRWLGELLAERGEHTKAERILTKARSLEAPGSADAPFEQREADAQDDLIASAERLERANRAALSPRQLLFAAAGVSSLVFLIAVILFLASPRDRQVPSPSSPPVDADLPPSASTTIEAVSLVEALPSASDEEVADIVETQSAPLPLPPVPPMVPLPASPGPMESSKRSSAAPRKATPAVRAMKRAAATETKARKVVVVQAPRVAPPSLEDTPSREAEPDEAVVRAELATATPDKLTARADALDARGQTALAAVYYRRALEIDPDYAPALVGIGWSILRAKKYSEAMDNATRALQLARGVDARPGLEASAIYQMGRVRYERGDRDAARRLLRQSISLPGTPAEAWFYLGEALSSDNSPAARQAYQKYLELMPEGHLADRARRAIQ